MQQPPARLHLIVDAEATCKAVHRESHDATAQPCYNHPFRFYLLHDQQPNAFATRGQDDT